MSYIFVSNLIQKHEINSSAYPEMQTISPAESTDTGNPGNPGNPAAQCINVFRRPGFDPGPPATPTQRSAPPWPSVLPCPPAAEGEKRNIT